MIMYSTSGWAVFEKRTVAILLLAMAFFSTFSTSHGCYLKNCPLGKREGKRNSEEVGARLCPRCGPEGEGRCFGPFTCCTRDGGCMIGIGSPDTAPCFSEQSSPVPCISEESAGHCGKDGQGQCASNVVCCTEDSCAISPECASPTSKGSEETLIKVLRGY